MFQNQNFWFGSVEMIHWDVSDPAQQRPEPHLLLLLLDPKLVLVLSVLTTRQEAPGKPESEPQHGPVHRSRLFRNRTLQNLDQKDQVWSRFSTESSCSGTVLDQNQENGSHRGSGQRARVVE